jgi:hypothetical protein
MLLLEGIERADFGQAIELVLAQFTDADGEIVHAAEGAHGAGAQDGAGGYTCRIRVGYEQETHDQRQR